jgi:hypothetical protein
VKIINDNKISKVISKNIVRYHNSSLAFLNNLINMPNIQHTFNSYFSDEAADIQGLIINSSKAPRIIKALCKDGYHI